MDETKTVATITLHEQNPEHEKSEVLIYKPKTDAPAPPKPAPLIEQEKYADLPNKIFDKLDEIEYKVREKKEKEFKEEAEK